MTKYIFSTGLFLFLLFHLVSCNNQISDNKLNYSIFSLSINENALTSYRKFCISSDTLFCYNPTKHSLDIFDFTNDSFLESIVLKKEGPEYLPIPLEMVSYGHFVCFLSLNQGVFSLNKKSREITNIALDDFHQQGFSFTNGVEVNRVNASVLDFPNLYIPVYKPRNKEPSYYDSLFVLKLDISSGKKELITSSYPKLFKENLDEYWPIHDSFFLTLSNKGDLVVSFAALPQVFKIDDLNQLMAISNQEDTNWPSASTLPYSISQLDAFRKREYSLGNVYYYGLKYFPKTGKYYRFVKGESDDLQITQLTNNYLMVYSQELDFEYSVELPKGVLPNFQEYQGKGLFFLADSEMLDEDEAEGYLFDF